MRKEAVITVRALLFAYLLFSAQIVESSSSRFRIARPDSVIDVAVLRDSHSLSSQLLTTWIKDAASAVASYYGVVPMKRIAVRVTPVSGSGVGFSTATEENGEGLIESRVGVASSAADLKHDWTLTHEMLHLAFPMMDDDHRWLAEGIATYVEPIARLRIGNVNANEVWGDLVDKLPGALRASKGGLNNARSVNGTYWGGALYCLLADIEIRKRTQGRKSLEDALRAIWKNGGDISSDWSFENAIAAGDKAIGVPVLLNLYRRMATSAPEVDLNKLWSELGIEKSGSGIVFNDHAPLAWIRQGIAPAK